MKKIIGLKEVVNRLETLKRRKHLYQNTNIRPPHFIINLSKSYGRTSLAKYIESIFIFEKLIDSNSSLDHLLEFELDGSYNNLHEIIKEINEKPIYKNEFNGIIAIGIEKLANHINEDQFTYFIESFKKFSNHSSLIFYLNYENNYKEKILIDSLKNEIDNLEVISTSKYTKEDYILIIAQELKENGIEIINDEMILEKIYEQVMVEDLSTIKDALSLSQEIISSVNFENTKRELKIENLQFLRRKIWTNNSN